MDSVRHSQQSQDRQSYISSQIGSSKILGSDILSEPFSYLQDDRKRKMEGTDIQKYLNKIFEGSKLDLIYSSKQDGDNAYIYHDRCDGSANTLTLIKTKSSTVNNCYHLFGGFRSSPIESDDMWKNDKQAFIFSVNKQKVMKAKNGNHAVCDYAYYGP